MFSPAIFCEFESLRTSSKSTKFSLSATRNHFSKAFIHILLVLTLLLSECYGVKIVLVVQRDILNITPSTPITMSLFTFSQIFSSDEFQMLFKFFSEYVWHLYYNIIDIQNFEHSELKIFWTLLPSQCHFAFNMKAFFQTSFLYVRKTNLILVCWTSYSQSFPVLLSHHKPPVLLKTVPHKQVSFDLHTNTKS